MRWQVPERIGRSPFLAWGSFLFLLKAGLDASAFLAFHERWSPLIYIHPVHAPLFHPAQSGWGLWFTLWGIAVPFLALGTLLSLARLRDAALPPGLIAFFFLPFANLVYFAALVLMPTREETRPAPAPETRGVSTLAAFWFSAASGAALFLGLMAISVGLLGAYGMALFVGAPFLCGLLVARLLVRLDPAPARIFRASSAALVAAGLATLVMIAFAQEGLVCILMASPLVAILALLGAVIGSLTFLPARASAVGCFALLPLLAWVDAGAPAGTRVVASEVQVQAPPDAVWRQVIAFPPLPPTREWIFRAGVANPLRAEIQGSGVGAVRRCVFSTGAFVEPVTDWQPGRRLAFQVQSQPDVLRELTLWAGPRPPHLDDYLQCTRGEFVLEPLPDGGTRLIGRTYYRLHMGPEAYWGLWSDAFIHRIHLRVLDHVKALAEAGHG